VRWIVYETRCLVSGKTYVGVHRQNEDGFDGYLGSGKALRRAIKKHGVENFVRRTLEEFSVEAEAYAREAEIVTEEFCKRRDTYNVKPGGFGGSGMWGRTHTPETRAKMSEKMRGNKNFLGRTHTPEAREKMRGNKNCLGRTHTPEARKKMSESQLRRWAERRAHAA
jgi:group I intron endonuclease